MAEGVELQVLEFVLHPAHAHAEAHAPAGELVDGGDGLGRVHGMAVGEHDDAGAEAHGARARGGVGEHGESVPPGALSGHPFAREVVGVARADGVGQEDVVDDPDGVEADLLGLVADGVDGVGVGDGADHGEHDAELHGRAAGALGHSSSSRPSPTVVSQRRASSLPSHSSQAAA